LCDPSIVFRQAIETASVLGHWFKSTRCDVFPKIQLQNFLALIPRVFFWQLGGIKIKTPYIKTIYSAAGAVIEIYEYMR
jgi:hypothetical protein